MTKIEVKLNKGSEDLFITTASGYTISKEQFTIVDDEDPYIESLLYNREDLDIREYQENFTDNNIKNEIFKE